MFAHFIGQKYYVCMCVFDWVFSINSLLFEDGLLTLKRPITTATESNFIFIYFFFFRE